jgi:hypothetical protein
VKKIATALVLTLVALAGCGPVAGQPQPGETGMFEPSATLDTSQVHVEPRRPAEDDPDWDCHLDGDHRCGGYEARWA